MAIDTETMQAIERCVAHSIANATSLKRAADEISKGVTQYVGARYVPLFAEPLEWDKTKAYEPLTIVLHQGSSYTSRQYVPVGVEIDDDSFWALTGNYSAQVEQYRQEVKALDGRITANADAIDAEIADRTAAVAAEAAARTAAVAAEAADRTAAVDAETQRAQKAESMLQANLELNFDKVYQNVQDMISGENTIGSTVKTNHYLDNDNGGSYYKIEQTGSGNNIDSFESGDAFCNLIYTSEMNVNQFGINSDNDDNTDRFNLIFSNENIDTLICNENDNYKLHSVNIQNSITVVGNGAKFSNNEFTKDKVTTTTDFSTAILFYSTTAENIFFYNCSFDGTADRVQIKKEFNNLSFCTFMFKSQKLIKFTGCRIENSYLTAFLIESDNKVYFSNCTFKNIGVLSPEGKSQNCFECYAEHAVDATDNVFSSDNIECIDIADEYARTDTFRNVYVSNLTSSNSFNVIESHHVEGFDNKYVYMSNCKGKAQLALCENANVDIVNCYVDTELDNGVAVIDGVLNLSASTIKATNSVYTSASDVNIEGCTLIGAKYCIYKTETNSNVNINNCKIDTANMYHIYNTSNDKINRIANCDIKITTTWYLESQDDVYIENNTIYSSYPGAISVSSGKKCDILNNLITLVCTDSSAAPITVKGDNVRVVGNTVISSGKINVSENIAEGADSLIIVDNYLFNNDYSFAAPFTVPANCVIHDNKWGSNYKGTPIINHDNLVMNITEP